MTHTVCGALGDRSLSYMGVRLNTVSVVSLVPPVCHVRRSVTDTVHCMVWCFWLHQANLVLSLGLSVDYSAHLARHFAVACEKKKDVCRSVHLEDSVWRLGASVFHGGFSTFVAVLPLAAAVSTIFQMFFKMVAMTVRLVGGARVWLCCFLTTLDLDYVRGRRRFSLGWPMALFSSLLFWVWYWTRVKASACTRHLRRWCLWLMMIPRKAVNWLL